MSNVVPEVSLKARLERELERERRERLQHDECRAGLAADDEFRSKEARGHSDAFGLKRSTVR
ncbi:hypothetical protein [uncultured Massilia sp.]|uniref:hypothetical protein n=1 Tax=uncultured Massilia sp. TaxID=169973 RepID=UPI0025CEFE24|nr:hypothetical protein [uncultured Massilia sp.]